MKDLQNFIYLALTFEFDCLGLSLTKPNQLATFFDVLERVDMSSRIKGSKLSSVGWTLISICINQIFIEIYFEDSRSAKSSILTHLEALNLEFSEFLHFLKADIHQKTKLKLQKLVVSAVLDSPKLIHVKSMNGRKIL